MKPVSYNEALLVDGDLIKSRPAWKIYEDLDNENTRILEFRLEGSRDGSDIKNPMDFVNSIINTIWYLSTEDVYNSYSQNDRYDFIVIDTKDIILFDFTIDKSKKEELAEKGYKAAKDYLSKTLPVKKEIISKKYKEIEKRLKLIKKSLKQKNTNNLIMVINEMLSEMAEDIKYVDKSIYENIKELKKEIINNIKKYVIFGNKIQNISEIEEKTEYIEKNITKRIKDLEEYVTMFSNKS